MTPASSPPSRITSIDALRGFAVMGILLVHNLEHFIYPVYPDAALQPGWLNALNDSVYILIFGLFAGKSYSIFALLFGFTFYVQFANEQAKGRDFGGRFLWRLLLLAGFGCLNASVFPGGDVLLLYAAVGTLLALVRHWGDRPVFILALICLLQPVEWYHFLRLLADPAYKIPARLCDPYYIEIIDAAKQGDFWNFIRKNLGAGQLASFFWALDFGRFFQTAGLMLTGLLIGRRGLFRSEAVQQGFWTRVLIVSAVAFGPLYQLKVKALDQQTQHEVMYSLGTMLDMWQKLAFTGVLAASFLLLYEQARFRQRVAPLERYGRMSLTNYLTQSFAGMLIYFPFFLNLAPSAGYALSLLIGILMFAAQLYVCQWWLGRYRQGPLEGLWHRLTWLSWGKARPAAG